MFREILHGFLEVIIKNISVETSPQETPHCRKTRANQRGRSEEKTYSNVPSRDVQQFSKRGATALRHRVHRTVVNSTNWWLLKQKICVFGQRIQDCAVSLCRFAGKSDYYYYYYLLLASILRSFRSRNTFQNVFLLLKLVISYRTSCWRPVST